MTSVYGLIALCLAIAAAAAAFALVRRGRTGWALALLALGPLLGVMPYTLTHLGPADRGQAVPADAPAPAAAPAAAPAPAVEASVAPISGARPTTDPDAAERDAAQKLRLAGKYAEARDAFRRLGARRPQDADAWADAADCAAAAANGDLGAGAADLARALAVQPRHPKALWLKASLELQQKHYPAAVALWEQLLAILPPGSEDRRIVEANLQEAKGLAAQAAAP